MIRVVFACSLLCVSAERSKGWQPMLLADIEKRRLEVGHTMSSLSALYKILYSSFDEFSVFLFVAAGLAL
jgi:hypothetical protein